MCAQLVSGVILLLSSGCICRIEYYPISKHKFGPVAEAKIVNGNAGRVLELAGQMKLPHNAESDRMRLAYELRHEVTSQLGSHDYRLIGAVNGVGNGYTNMAWLHKELARRAAKEGGDVLLIIEEKVHQQPVTFTTPGYATTNVYGNTAYTQYQPGTTYTGTISFPMASGIVLRYSPGYDALIQRLLHVDDATLLDIDHQLAALESRKLPDDEWEKAYRELVTAVAPESQPYDFPSIARADTQPADRNLIGNVSRSIVTVEADKYLGSGFCVGAAGTIVTAAHVIENASAIMVETATGERLSAIVLKTDKESDLAVLMVNRSAGLQPLPIRPDTPTIGEDCFVFGSPKGLSGTVTKGIVSAIRSRRGVQVVQTDAAINKGNSGGPLIDGQGRVIGVCDFKFAGDTEGLAFAVGIEPLRVILGLPPKASLAGDGSPPL